MLENSILKKRLKTWCIWQNVGPESYYDKYFYVTGADVDLWPQKSKKAENLKKKTKHWRKGFTPSLNGNMWVPNLMTTTFFTWKVSAMTFDPKNSKWLKNWQNITQRRKGFKLSLYGNMWVPNLITTYIFTWKVPVLTFDPKIPK